MILFRCDSSYEIGIGHVLRCLNFAKILRPLGFDVEFACEDLPGHICSQIQNQGFQLHILPKGEDLRLVQKLKPAWLVIDHYGIDEHWEKQVPASTKIFVIDDLVNRRHFCQVLLDQNYRKETPDYKSKVPASCRLLIGTQYCLLKPELNLKPAIKPLPSRPQVLIFFGGTDESGETVKAAKVLSQVSISASFQIVGLNSQKHIQELKALTLPDHIQLLLNPENWVELLKNSDFYFGSGGSVTWERLFLGIPGAILAVADNQVGPNQDLNDEGYQLFWGMAKKFDYSRLPGLLENLFADPATLQKMAMRGQSLVSKFDPSLAQNIFSTGV